MQKVCVCVLHGVGYITLCVTNLPFFICVSFFFFCYMMNTSAERKKMSDSKYTSRSSISMDGFIFYVSIIWYWYDLNWSNIIGNMKHEFVNTSIEKKGTSNKFVRTKTMMMKQRTWLTMRMQYWACRMILRYGCRRQYCCYS